VLLILWFKAAESPSSISQIFFAGLHGFGENGVSFSGRGVVMVKIMFIFQGGMWFWGKW